MPSAAREYLYSLEKFGIKLGLDNIRHLLAEGGDPHLAVPCIHVAGSNGKGSVLALLDAMLRAAGYTTARYTSPHLIRLNERFLHNATPIDDGVLDEHIAFFQGIAEAMDPPPTFFELVTAVAFRWFADIKPDLALIEVGLGGRFDSTNVIEPILTGITNIDLEHTEHLGETVEQIAFEKAGIVKPAVPLVLGETREDRRDVITQQAAFLQSPVTLLDRDFRYTLAGDAFDQQFTYEGERWRIGPVRLGLCGSYQGPNAAVATAMAEWLAQDLPQLTPEAVAAGLKAARWPCRLERVLDDPPVIIDVAHNAAGALRLGEQLGRCVVVLAVSGDKAAHEMIGALAPHAETLILTEFTGHRAMPVDILAECAGSVPHVKCSHLHEAIELGIEKATPDAPLVITGSVFTAGEARGILMRDHGAHPPAF